jgi:hypothetical protein
VLLRPVCQPVLSPGTVAVAHPSAPFPPLLFGWPRDVATPRSPREPWPGRCRAARTVPHRSGHRPPLSARPLLHVVPHPEALTSPLPHPPPLQKSRPLHRALFFFPSLSSAHSQASHLSSTLATEPLWPSACFQPPPSPPPRPHGETHQSAAIS